MQINIFIYCRKPYWQILIDLVGQVLYWKFKLIFELNEKV